MKHYLDLVNIQTKQRRKQSRMTRLCIILAVFLVTAIFGMADMEIRSQMIQAVKTDGSWHAAFLVNEEQGTLLGARPEVERIARYGALNYRLEDGYQIEGIETGICGFDKELQQMIPDAEASEGSFPETAGGIVVNENVSARLGAGVGDPIYLTTPWGDVKQYRITGIAKNTELTAKLDAFCIFLNTDGFSELETGKTGASKETLYYVQFRKYCNIQNAIDEICGQFGLEPEQVSRNEKVLMLMFQSRDSYLMRLYLTAAVLAALVVIAGTFMITASMNSNIARRTEFFGMMRCLGATRKQIARFVRKEALSWCKSAIPAGATAGVLVVWALCGMLRYLSPGLFDGLPVFGVSWPGIAAGAAVGFVTVILAARSPAKRAAKVSPLTAVSGNAGIMRPVKRAANTRLFRVDTALGVHHGVGNRKNFFLVAGSFAFSIILFLSFSTAVDFMHRAITPLRPSAPDLCIYQEDNSNQIPSELAETVRGYPGVERAFGRSYAELALPADGKTIIVVSYDEQQFQWAEEALLEGGIQEAEEGKGVLSVFREGDGVTVGSKVRMKLKGAETEVPVVGVLGEGPFRYGEDRNTNGGKDLVICSEKLFRKLTGEGGYAALDVQLSRKATERQVQEIRKAMEQACETGASFSDRRIGNQEIKGASYSLSVFLYGFLAVIAVIGCFNIMNSIAMSVSARMKEYGAMRAIGMSVGQLIRMVSGEAAAYLVSGTALGCAVGLPLNRALFQSLVTSRWGDAWSVPGRELMVIAAIMLGSVCLAVAGPARQFRRMSAADTINRE